MLRSLVLFVSALILSACPAMAKTFYVGGCHAGSFSSISAAVSAVPAGSIIDICPGTYSEQVIISKSLTLQGFTSQNNNAVLICCAQGSDAESQVLGLELIPMIWVTAGTVNLSNIYVYPGIGVASGCPQLPTGIFYSSGTSGTMNHLSLLIGTGVHCGAGIVAENDTVDGSSIKIENSYIDSDNFGILMGSRQPEGTNPVLLNTITGNTIADVQHGMFLLQSRGKVSGNNITLLGKDPANYGIFLAAPATAITDNTISGVGTGVLIDGASAVVTANRISASVGVDLGCTAETVNNNTIYAGTGLDHVPATFTGKNIFMLTSNLIAGGC